MEEVKVCAVSMEDKGMLLLRAFSDISPTSPTGFISIKSPSSYVHAQLPPIRSQQVVLLLDRQCTTGEEACIVLKHLVQNRQVSPRNIYFVTAISSFEGLQNVHRNFPDVALVTAQVDTVLDPEQRIRPGIGDFMQRYWNVGSN